MNQLGFSVMLKQMCSNKETVEAYKKMLNKTIEKIEIKDNHLYITFKEDYKVDIFDDGQSCCEHRYMVCDNDLKSFIGDTLIDIDLKSTEAKEEDYSAVHEIEFLEIKTNKGTISIANHNEHNGYYGGFALDIKEVKNI